MSYVYYQKAGYFLHNGLYLATGYAGRGQGKNNPLMQNVKDIGPICRGVYFMGKPNEQKGPATIPLTPSSFNEMFGREGFLIHGDNPDHIGDSSEGCIILPHDVRIKVIESLPAENMLFVV